MQLTPAAVLARRSCTTRMLTSAPWRASWTILVRAPLASVNECVAVHTRLDWKGGLAEKEQSLIR